jgi:hypothetical protein
MIISCCTVDLAFITKKVFQWRISVVCAWCLQCNTVTARMSLGSDFFVVKFTGLKIPISGVELSQ